MADDYKSGNSFMKKIKLFCMDVDGTLTDGKIYVGSDGEVFKAFNTKDGLGIHDLLIKNDIIPVIITGRKSKIVENRCAELGIKEIYQGISNKIEVLQELCKKYNVSFENFAYVGDDLNDLPCMEKIKSANGFVACPNDAADDVKKIADYISVKSGGNGAVRDVVDYIFEGK